MVQNSPRLIGIGGAHIDRRGQVTGIYVPATSNPGAMREDVGGVVFNALRNARMRGVEAALISMRGGDSSGERIARAIGDAGIDDRSAVFLDRASASYTALIDRDGELIAGLADMDLYAGFARQLRRSASRDAIAQADAVLCDANLHADALDLVVRHAAGKPVHAIGISPAKVVRLAGLLDRLACIFMNRAEAAALSGLPGEADAGSLAAALSEQGVARGVITAGGRRLTLFEGSRVWAVEPPRPRTVADVTGAGDALAGASVAALLRGLDFVDAVREGMAAAMLALESPQAVAELGGGAFEDALALVPHAGQMA